MTSMKAESDVGAKDAMLWRIRAALGRGGYARRPPPLAAYVSQTRAVGPSELIERFRREAETANVFVSIAETEGDIQKYLDSFVLRDASGVVALSDGVAAAHGELARWLSGRGLRVVVPPGELSPDSSARGADSSRDRGAAPRPGVSANEDFKAALFDADVGITSADYAIADTGTLVLRSGGERHRLTSLLPPVHVCLLNARRILGSMGDLLALFDERGEARERLPQALTFITGPSRTADVEQTLALGVHGPHELHVLLSRVL